MFLRLVLCFGVALMLVGAAAADVPQLINYQGILLDTAGDPVTVPTMVLFAIWNAEMDGDSLWSEEQSVSPDDEGRFSVLLGSVSPIPDSAFAGAETYLSVKVDTDPEMTPRQRFASVAYAFRAGGADGALYADSTDAITDGGVDLTDIGQSGAVENQVIKWNGAAWAVADDETGTDGDITSVEAGNGLTGGGTTGDVIVDIDSAWVDAFVDTCDARYADGSGYADSTDAITDGGVDFADIGQNGAAENQIIKWDGAAWAAADDETGTGGDNDWTLNGDVLYTGDEWGLARARNVLYGDYDSTHVNLGVASTTGTSGQHYKYATVGGGRNNTASDEGATVGGGISNTASGPNNTVAGGRGNQASDRASTVSGGEVNTASGFAATVGGGFLNTAGGRYSFAAGAGAKANHDGSFCLAANYHYPWGDSVHTGGEEQMVLRADGGLYLTNTCEVAPYDPTNIITTRGGAYLSGNGTTWTNASDRNQKENFAALDREELLAKIAALPITSWNYKDETAEVTHIGPVAQDFHALFGVGGDDKSISTIDPAGIALAAIQGLYQQNQEQQQRIEELETLVTKLQEEKE